MREDLLIKDEVLRQEWPPCVSFKHEALAFPVTFYVNNTTVWECILWKQNAPGWQIADLVDGRYQNHRGFTDSLQLSLFKALEGHGIEIPQPLKERYQWNAYDVR